MIDRASDAWGVSRAVLEGKRGKVIASLLTAVAYGLCYPVLREASNDQWFLPAGFRFACLLIAPFRLWPALFAGEIAAIACIRYRTIGLYGLPWYVGSLFVSWPPVALVVHQLRTRTRSPHIERPVDAVALAVGGVIAAEATTFAAKACTAFLRPGGSPIQYSNLIVYSLGDIQGIMLATFGVLLFTGFRAGRPTHDSFVVEAVTGVAVTALVAAVLVAVDIQGETPLVAGRLALLLPVIALAMRHGWRGACIGAIAADLALFATIPAQGKGMSDGPGLIMQEVFTFVSWLLVVVGVKANAGAGGPAIQLVMVAEREGRTERDRYEAMESHLRESALRAETMQNAARGGIDSVVSMLRRRGQSEAAMSLIGATHRDSAEFRRIVIDDIYPLTVERDGLYGAFQSEAFLRRFGASRHQIDITGSPHDFRLGTQLSAYRVICEALEYFAASSPARMHLRIRCSPIDGVGRISIAIAARDPAITERSAVDTAGLARLRTRAIAFGGSLHSRPGRLRVILADGPVPSRQRKPRRRPETIH